jgi:hypothetical protein
VTALEGEFRIPGASDRTVVIGMNGTGKTILGAWLLSLQRFDRRPWVILDYKGEELWDQVGEPPLRPLRVGQMPGKRGLYLMSVNPGDEEALEAWLWKVWERGDIGLFCDEVSLIPEKEAFKAILRQGRSKLIPVISCTQRPVDCDREVFSESTYRSIFRIGDDRDLKTLKGLTGNRPIGQNLPPFWSYWYDARQDVLLTLRPVPAPSAVAASIRAAAPRSWLLSG